MNPTPHPAAATAESQPQTDTEATNPVQPPRLTDDLDLDHETLGERQPDAYQPVSCAGGCE